MSIQNIDIKKVETLVNRDLNKRYLDPDYKVSDILVDLKEAEVESNEGLVNLILEVFLNNKEFSTVYDCELSRVRDIVVIKYRKGV